MLTMIRKAVFIDVIKLRILRRSFGIILVTLNPMTNVLRNTKEGQVIMKIETRMTSNQPRIM